MSARCVLVLIVPLLISGCAKPLRRFPVIITALTDDGKPVSGLAVSVGNQRGKTNKDGQFRIAFAGDEGMNVPVNVVAPKGYRIPQPVTSVVLKQITDIDTAGGRVLPIERTVRLEPLVRTYAVMVDAGVAGLPVETFGTQRAMTNSRGVAIFLYEGVPGDDLKVKLVTGTSRLKPQNPIASFVLGSRSDAYVFKEHFETPRAPAPLRKKHAKSLRIRHL